MAPSQDVTGFRQGGRGEESIAVVATRHHLPLFTDIKPIYGLMTMYKRRKSNISLFDTSCDTLAPSSSRAFPKTTTKYDQ
jgi:hypothetical protein